MSTTTYVKLPFSVALFSFALNVVLILFASGLLGTINGLNKANDQLRKERREACTPAPAKPAFLTEDEQRAYETMYQAEMRRMQAEAAVKHGAARGMAQARIDAQSLIAQGAAQ